MNLAISSVHFCYCILCSFDKQGRFRKLNTKIYEFANNFNFFLLYKTVGIAELRPLLKPNILELSAFIINGLREQYFFKTFNFQVITVKEEGDVRIPISI